MKRREFTIVGYEGGNLTSAYTREPINYFLNWLELATNGAQAQFVIPTNATGAAQLPATVPNVPGLPGMSLYFQFLAAASSKLVASNALEVIFYR